MLPWIWINGETLPAADVHIGVEDRGFQFADGVYEVIRTYAGKPFTLREHLQRLQRSAESIHISLPLSIGQLSREIVSFIAKTQLGEGMIYLQLTRGVAERNHAIPKQIKPTLLFYGVKLDPLPPVGQSAGWKVIPVPDERWQRCYIKSIALLPNVLAKHEAISAGADEAVFIDNGHATEGCATNFWTVIDGVVVTAPNGPKILPGITRDVLLKIAPAAGVKIIERSIAEREIATASELFLTSSTKEIMWISHWAGKEIFKSIGPVSRKLHEAYREHLRKML